TINEPCRTCAGCSSRNMLHAPCSYVGPYGKFVWCSPRQAVTHSASRHSRLPAAPHASRASAPDRCPLGIVARVHVAFGPPACDEGVGSMSVCERVPSAALSCASDHVAKREAARVGDGG